MIGLLTGRIVRRRPSGVILDVGGVGYEVTIPLSTFYALPADGAAATLEIHTLVREDAILLFGFGTPAERTIFEALISVSGIGPKVALAILAALAPADIVRAVTSGDVPRLRAVPGVGRKLAERIVLELREKAGKLGLDAAHASAMPAETGEEAESALLHLGYEPAQAREALRRARGDSQGPMPIEALLREALRILGR